MQRRYGKCVVDRIRESLYIWGMEVHFTPEQEAQLFRIASHEGTNAERLVKDAALRLLEEKMRFSAAVRQGIAAADRGQLIDHDEVRACDLVVPRCPKSWCTA